MQANPEEKRNQIRNLYKQVYPHLQRIREIRLAKDKHPIGSPRYLQLSLEEGEIERFIEDIDAEIQALREVKA